MENLQIFTKDEIGTIRIKQINGEIYFVANDVAKALGYSNPSKATNDHCKRARMAWGNDSLGRRQEFKIIPEGDVYRLITRSKLESAEFFENWIFEEVLPTIRKTGGGVSDEYNDLPKEKNNYININFDEQTVSARELHKILRIGTEFRKWFPRMTEYGFLENGDYERVCHKCPTLGGEQTMVDYNISLDMAKHICMIQRTPEGKYCRQYLIDLEKAWNTPEQIFARALKMADVTIEKLKGQNFALLQDVKRMKPKEEFFDAVADSKDAIDIGNVAKVLNFHGIGRNKLFEILRDEQILMKDNIPYQKYIDKGYFRTIEQKYTVPNGETRINIKTLVYQKGVDFIRKVVRDYIDNHKRSA